MGVLICIRRACLVLIKVSLSEGRPLFRGRCELGGHVQSVERPFLPVCGMEETLGAMNIILDYLCSQE